MSRSIPVCIILCILTCGLYNLYWLVVLNDDLNELSGDSGVSGGLLILFTILTCGIYMIFWYYKSGEKVQISQENHGMRVSENLGILYILLSFFGLGIIAFALMQDSINKMVS